MELLLKDVKCSSKYFIAKDCVSKINLFLSVITFIQNAYKKNFGLKYTLIVVFLVSGSLKLRSQNLPIIDSLFYTDNSEKKIRKFLKPKSKYNPLAYLGSSALFIYQNVVSEQIQATCSYQHSCSEFTKLCIRDYGFIKGALMGINQILACMPALQYEVHPIFLTPTALIKNEHYLKR